MNIVVVTPPPVEPVTAAEAFFQLKLTTEPDADVSVEPQLAEVSRCITTAREQCEQITRRAFVEQTLRMTLPPPRSAERRGLAWHMNCGAAAWPLIELRRPPLIEITAVRYYDDGNLLQEVDPLAYFVEAGFVPRLRFDAGFVLPSTYIREDAVQIEYVAGYRAVPAVPAGPGTVAMPIDFRANVPSGIKSAILLGVQLLFDKLTPAEAQAFENARAALLSSFRVQTL